MTLPFWMIYDDREGLVPPVKATNVSMVEPERYVEAGLWHTADTLPELAAGIGVDADNLVSTVKRFNEFVAAGVDEDFGRGEEAYDRVVLGRPVTDGADRQRCPTTPPRSASPI